MDIGIIGAGNMGAALIKGISKSSKFQGLNLHVFDVDKSKVDNLNDFNVIYENDVSQLIKNVYIVIIAVKPKIVKEILLDIRDLICKKVVISTAVGIPIKFYLDLLGYDKKVIRVMPNTPALVSEGMTAISFSENIEKDEKDIALKIFESVGKVQILEENLMTKITSLIGSSPAYIFMLIEAMADAAVSDGIPRDISYKLAAQTVLGSAKMVLETGLHPGILKDQVCSPSGTTIEAVSKLEELGFRSSIINAMKVCTKKAIEISKKFSTDKVP